jgi:hypothetical protein
LCAFVLHYPASRYRMNALNTKTQSSHIHTLALHSASVWTSASTPDSFAHAHLYSPRTLLRMESNGCRTQSDAQGRYRWKRFQNVILFSSATKINTLLYNITVFVSPWEESPSGTQHCKLSQNKELFIFIMVRKLIIRVNSVTRAAI